MPPENERRPLARDGAPDRETNRPQSTTSIAAIVAALAAADLDANLAARLVARRSMRRYGGPSSWEDLVEQAEACHARAHRDERFDWAERFLAIRDVLVDRMEAAS